MPTTHENKLTLPSWIIKEDGPSTASDHMERDRIALKKMESGQNHFPTLRFFEWSRPVVTYGYLIDPQKAKSWALSQGCKEIVQRPTGGGAVFHHPTDLNLSLLWPRFSGILPDHPRASYAAIHTILGEGIDEFMERPMLHLYMKPSRSGVEKTSSEISRNRFSACFEQPVCFDVMLGQKKIVGGALRITKKAILYQGTVKWEGMKNRDILKKRIGEKFSNCSGRHSRMSLSAFADRSPCR